MTSPPPDRPRRPLPATGRQDRHARSDGARVVEPSHGDADEQPAPHQHLAPRGSTYYHEGRRTSYGFGCLVGAGLIGIAVAGILIIIAFMPAQDEIGTIVSPPSSQTGAQPESQPAAADGND